MTITPFHREDVCHFMAMATAERWVVETWELDFLRTVFPQGCFCARDKADKGVGFVTSLAHGRSGWIGNLIVSPKSRSTGIGEALFKKALETLQSAGVETLWLTASKQGKSLYEKHGFSTIDTILRWRGFGKRRHIGHVPNTDISNNASSVSSIDFQAWGDRRDVLLSATIGHGRLLLRESGFLVIQPCGEARQFGPLSALDFKTAENVFETALCEVPHETMVFIDAPASNRAAVRLFSRNCMQIAGTNELMYAGKKPNYRSEYLFGLATMGSCG